jgi:hypothetical protein
MADDVEDVVFQAHHLEMLRPGVIAGESLGCCSATPVLTPKTNGRELVLNLLCVCLSVGLTFQSVFC